MKLNKIYIYSFQSLAIFNIEIYKDYGSLFIFNNKNIIVTIEANYTNNV